MPPKKRKVSVDLKKSREPTSDVNALDDDFFKNDLDKNDSITNYGDEDDFCVEFINEMKKKRKRNDDSCDDTDLFPIEKDIKDLKEVGVENFLDDDKLLMSSDSEDGVCVNDKPQSDEKHEDEPVQSWSLDNYATTENFDFEPPDSTTQSTHQSLLFNTVSKSDAGSLLIGGRLEKISVEVVDEEDDDHLIIDESGDVIESDKQNKVGSFDGLDESLKKQIDSELGNPQSLATLKKNVEQTECLKNLFNIPLKEQNQDALYPKNSLFKISNTFPPTSPDSKQAIINPNIFDTQQPPKQSPPETTRLSDQPKETENAATPPVSKRRQKLMDDYKRIRSTNVSTKNNFSFVMNLFEDLFITPDMMSESEFEIYNHLLGAVKYLISLIMEHTDDENLNKIKDFIANSIAKVIFILSRDQIRDVVEKCQKNIKFQVCSILVTVMFSSWEYYTSESSKSLPPQTQTRHQLSANPIDNTSRTFPNTTSHQYPHQPMYQQSQHNRQQSFFDEDFEQPQQPLHQLHQIHQQLHQVQQPQQPNLFHQDKLGSFTVNKIQPGTTLVPFKKANLKTSTFMLN